MTAKKKSLVFIIICCCLLTAAVFLSVPAGALDSGTSVIYGKIPLVTYNIFVSGIGQSSATVIWKTNSNANSTVEYGTTTLYGSLGTDGAMAADHTISLYGLLPGTVYHYRVISVDVMGNRAASTDLTFTTESTPLPPPGPVPGGDGGDGGGGMSPPFMYPSEHPKPGLPQQPQKPAGQNVEVSQNYAAGFVGMFFNADDKNTLILDLSKAEAGGVAVTLYPDHIDVYQHNSPGVLFRFWGDMSDIGDTDRIVKKVDSAELWTDPLTEDLTTGTYSVSLHAMTTRILLPSTINITVSSNISPYITGKIRNVSEQNNLRMENIAYTMNVDIYNYLDTGAANVTMTLPASWVDQEGGTGSIHIARISDETGTTELLNTVFVGTDPGGTMTFQGDSPNGTSLFGIFSARPTNPQKQEQYNEKIQIFQTPALIIQMIHPGWLANPIFTKAILIIVITAIAAIAIYFGWRRQKKS